MSNVSARRVVRMEAWCLCVVQYGARVLLPLCHAQVILRTKDSQAKLPLCYLLIIMVVSRAWHNNLLGGKDSLCSIEVLFAECLGLARVVRVQVSRHHRVNQGVRKGVHAIQINQTCCSCMGSFARIATTRLSHCSGVKMSSGPIVAEPSTSAPWVPEANRIGASPAYCACSSATSSPHYI